MNITEVGRVEWSDRYLDPAEEEASGGRATAGWSRVRMACSNPSTVVGAALGLIVIVPVVLAPLIGRYDPNAIDINALNHGPSSGHYFGTDSFGRDLWARVLYGGRVSLLTGAGVVALESVIGVPLGLLAGYIGRAVDSVAMRLMDVLLSLPGLLVALGIVAVMGPGVRSTIVAIGVGGVPGYARMARAMTRKVRAVEYVDAARSQGVGGFRLVRRHILPNAVAPLVVMATTSFGGAVLAASALSYLGVGLQPPNSDWGTLLNDGYQHMFQASSEILFPGIAVTLTVLAGNLLGDGLADALDPRSR